MQHEYGIKPEEIKWVVSSKDSSAKASGGASKLENVLPKGLSIRTGPKGKDESDLLVDGDVDALFHAAEPRAYQEGHPKVARLFADSRKTERAYFTKTGIFPIMHAVAVRKDVIQAHPRLPKAVFHAYSQAKQLMYEEIKKKCLVQDVAAVDRAGGGRNTQVDGRKLLALCDRTQSQGPECPQPTSRDSSS